MSYIAEQITILCCGKHCFAVASFHARKYCSTADVSILAVYAFVVGIAIAFGFRLAGGCKSEHGLSGQSAILFASLVTAAGMFGGGILTRLFT